MSGSATVFLAIIAVSVLVMALMQVGVLLYAARLGRRFERLTARVEQDIRPLLEHIETVGSNAAEVSRLAVLQAQRAEEMLSEFSARADRAVTNLQSALRAPVREGRALVAGIRAGVAAAAGLRYEARARRARVQEEDPLFIG